MNRSPLFAALAFVFVTGLSVRAEEKRPTVDKNAHQAGDKVTTTDAEKPTKPAKKKKGLFSNLTKDLDKDRSLPKEEGQGSNAKDAPKGSLTEELHRERSN